MACDICWGGCGFTQHRHFDLFPPTAHRFLWVFLGFPVPLIDLLGLWGKVLRTERQPEWQGHFCCPSGKRWDPGTLLVWSVSCNENNSFCCFLMERSNILQEINKPNPNAAPCQIKTDCFSLLSLSIQQTSCESCVVYETTTHGYLTSSPPFPSFLFYLISSLLTDISTVR